MGRLIDADKLNVYLQEYLHYGHAIPWVDAQPTAYDVEKVVEELESKRDHRELINDYGDVIGVLNIDTIKIDKAIDIVKRGGI